MELDCRHLSQGMGNASPKRVAAGDGEMCVGFPRIHRAS